jgi:hypothetical protein
MQEPAYILKNGTTIPYIPSTITTSRDAYAASLHVLFKHVADFHICVVRAFSAKYGIPEDDILKTIQESDEFKNMHVDPVLDTDKFNTLGYLQSTSVQAEPVKEAALVVKKPKSNKVNPAVVEPIVVAEEERHDPAPATNVVALQEQEPIKPNPIRKKVVQNPAVELYTAVNLCEIDLNTTNVIAANTDGTLQAQPMATIPSTTAESEPSETIKSKTIRKKVVQKPVVAPMSHASVAPMSHTNTADAPRKIIRKKINAV